jgi:hypothetical protein
LKVLFTSIFVYSSIRTQDIIFLITEENCNFTLKKVFVFSFSSHIVFVVSSYLRILIFWHYRKWRGGCSIKFHNIKSLLKLTCSQIIWLFDQKFYQLQITFDKSLHQKLPRKLLKVKFGQFNFNFTYVNSLNQKLPKSLQNVDKIQRIQNTSTPFNV